MYEGVARALSDVHKSITFARGMDARIRECVFTILKLLLFPAAESIGAITIDQYNKIGKEREAEGEQFQSHMEVMNIA